MRIAFTSAAMYPVSVMFIVTTTDRMLTTLYRMMSKTGYLDVATAHVLYEKW